MLEIINISKKYGGVIAVNNFSLKLNKSKITSLIGPNGSGKTTIFNIITGYVVPDTGQVIFKNNPICKLTPWKISRIGISRTFDSIRLFKNMTTLENVLMAQQRIRYENIFNAIFKYAKRLKEFQGQLEEARYLLNEFDLYHKKNELASNISYGQQKLLSIACCFASNPNIVLLDEPVSGIYPVFIIKIINIIKKMSEKEKKTIFLIEHNIEFVKYISDFVVRIVNGEKVFEGIPSSI